MVEFEKLSDAELAELILSAEQELVKRQGQIRKPSYWGYAAELVYGEQEKAKNEG